MTANAAIPAATTISTRRLLALTPAFYQIDPSSHAAVVSKDGWDRCAADPGGRRHAGDPGAHRSSAEAARIRRADRRRRRAGAGRRARPATRPGGARHHDAEAERMGGGAR